LVAAIELVQRQYGSDLERRIEICRHLTQTITESACTFCLSQADHHHRVDLISGCRMIDSRGGFTCLHGLRRQVLDDAGDFIPTVVISRFGHSTRSEDEHLITGPAVCDVTYAPAERI